jgi:hypothetical protein
VGDECGFDDPKKLNQQKCILKFMITKHGDVQQGNWFLHSGNLTWPGNGKLPLETENTFAAG